MKLCLILLCALTLGAQPGNEELQGELKVTGKVVEVRLRHKDGQPAAGVPVRCLNGAKLTAAAARTDRQGRCQLTIPKAGDYEIQVDPESGGGTLLPMVFSVEEVEEADTLEQWPQPAPFPWIPTSLGLGCLVLAALLFVIFRLNPALGSGNPILRGGGVALLAAGAVLLGWSGWGFWRKPTPAAAPPSGPNLALTAREYLWVRNIQPLSGPLGQLLAEAKDRRVPTQTHPLLGKPAPDFELLNHRREPWRLQDRTGQGPVVLVFYYGYYCNHCVGQLFALHDDIAKFHELGAEVVAVSADAPELTQKRFRQYGPFAFPVLSDPDNKVAQKYDVYRPPAVGQQETLLHGTFVIGRDGRVHWAQYGDVPFTGNQTLLYELARLEGRLPGSGTK
jgi:peroxiredoxin